MPKKPNTPYLSVILPIYNEEESLPELVKELCFVCDSLGRDYEIIFINDCSTDNTYEMLCRYAEKDKKIKVVRFSKNFGHQAAISAGLEASKGKLVMTMDSDLQHPPRLIPEFIKRAEVGFDIVIAERMAVERRSFLREFAGRIIYKFLSLATGLEFKNAGDFVLYKRRVVDVINGLSEREKFFRGLAQWVGFKKTYIPYTIEARKFGKGASIKGLSKFILNGVTSFSAFPLRVSFWIGLFIFLISVGYGMSVIVEKILYPENLIEGLSSLTIVVLALGSVQLMVIGVMGEYLYKMFNEIKGRPVYIIAETRNMDKEGTVEW